MAAKYHITDDGAKPCKATVQSCPIGGEHFDNADEAKKAFEATMEEKTFATHKKAEDSKVDKEKDSSANPTVSYKISEHNKEKAEKLIARLNRKLERAGIAERFEITFEPKIYKWKTMAGVHEIEHATPYFEATVNTPSISYNGYHFKAVMERAESGSDKNSFLTRSARDVELGGWRPEKMVCEHCGHNRTRNKTFLIEGPDGERKQIGSSCVTAYLGVKPEGLNYMFDDPISGMEEDEGYFMGGGGGGTGYDTRETLALALAVSNEGDNFVGSSSYDKSTIEEVNDALYGGKHVDTAWQEEMLTKAAKLKASGAVDELRKTIAELPDDNDYARNLKAIVETEGTRGSNGAILVSAVSVLKRAKRLERIAREKEERERLKQEKRDSYSKGHYADVGEKIPKGTKMTVMETREYEVQGYGYYADTIKKTAVTLRSESGHMIVWFANKTFKEEEVAVGKDIEISSGVVKGHGEFDGIDQTIVSRLRLITQK